MNKKWVEAFEKMTYGIHVLTSKAGEAANGMMTSWVKPDPGNEICANG